MFVQLSVFKLARAKLGALYTQTPDSARKEKCPERAYCAPTPYTIAALVSVLHPQNCHQSCRLDQTQGLRLERTVAAWQSWAI